MFELLLSRDGANKNYKWWQCHRIAVNIIWWLSFMVIPFRILNKIVHYSLLIAFEFQCRFQTYNGQINLKQQMKGVLRKLTRMHRYLINVCLKFVFMNKTYKYFTDKHLYYLTVIMLCFTVLIIQLHLVLHIFLPDFMSSSILVFAI